MIESGNAVAALRLAGGAQIVIKRGDATERSPSEARLQQQGFASLRVATVNLPGGAHMLVTRELTNAKETVSDSGNASAFAGFNLTGATLTYQSAPLKLYSSQLSVEFQPSRDSEAVPPAAQVEIRSSLEERRRNSAQQESSSSVGLAAVGAETEETEKPALTSGETEASDLIASALTRTGDPEETLKRLEKLGENQKGRTPAQAAAIVAKIEEAKRALQLRKLAREERNAESVPVETSVDIAA